MVDFTSINKKVRALNKVLKSQVHKSGKARIGIRSMEAFLEEEEAQSGIKTPSILRKILIEYGTHRLNFRILKPLEANRYIFGRGVMHGTSMYDWGGFDKIRYTEHNNDAFLQIPLEGAYLWEDLFYGKYILIREKKTAVDEEDVEIILYEYPDKFTVLEISLEEYFSLLPKTFGMYCWQEYLTPEDYLLDGGIPDHFHENMKTLFPEVDLSIFRAAPELDESSVYNRYRNSTPKKDYRQTFIQLMEKLEAHPDVKFQYYEKTEGYKYEKTKYTARYGVTEDVLRKIRKDYGREISPQMMAFYYQMNGCKVDWCIDKPEEGIYIEGKINFLPLEEVMGGKWHQSYLDWSSPNLFRDEDAVYHFSGAEALEYPEMTELMKKARIFDEQGEMQDYFIEFVEGKEEPNIYKVVRTEYYLMDIDFITFIEARIEFAGIKGWEYRFYDAGHPEEDKNRFIAEFKERVLKVLPDADFKYSFKISFI